MPAIGEQPPAAPQRGRRARAPAGAAPAKDNPPPAAPQAQLRALVVDVLGSRRWAPDRRLHVISRRAVVDRDEQIARGLEASESDAVGTEAVRTIPLVRCFQAGSDYAAST